MSGPPTSTYYPQQGGTAGQGYQPPYAAGGNSSGYAPVNTKGGATYDPEAGVMGSGGESYLDWADRSVRMGFVRKVYGILSCQLMVTLGTCLLFLYNDSVRSFVYSHPGVLISAWVLTLVVVIALACCGEVRRKYPMNMILLAAFTLAESYLVGAISSSYQTESVLLAIIMTTAVTVGLTLFAFQTKYDFTMMGGWLFSMLLIFVLFGFFRLWFPSTELSETIYAAMGAIIFSLYIVYDTQLLMGGKHKKYQLSPDEYVFAALNLYLDIVNLFLYLLALFGNRR